MDARRTAPSSVPSHPAKFSTPILDATARVLTEHSPNRPLRIVDPFAGVGGVHELHANGGHDTVGVEIQPEWANQHPRTQVGDATALPFDDDEFDALVCSPCYGNRFADHHNAREMCSKCQGDGCAKCGLTGVRGHHRISYAHYLRAAGAEPVDVETNAQTLAWGPQYRVVHEQAWREAVRVVKPGGLLIVNVSNHIRGGVEQNVVEWHAYVFIALSCLLWEAKRIATRRHRDGANRDARVDGETLLVFHAPGGRLSWA